MLNKRCLGIMESISIDRLEVKSMAEARFNTKLNNVIKDILFRLHHGAAPDDVQAEFHEHFKDVDAVDILLIVHECIHGDDGLSFQDAEKLFSVYSKLYGHSLFNVYVSEADHPGHPVGLFQAENRALQSALQT